jgi:hypothetical protein
LKRPPYLLIGFIAIILSGIAVCTVKENNRVAELQRWRSVPIKDVAKQFRELLAEADKRQIRYQIVEILYRKWDDILFWKADFSQELLDLLIEQWKLVPDKQIAIRTAFMLKSIPPNFFSNETTSLDIYADPEWITPGEARNQSFVIRDKANNKLIVKVSFYY